MSAQGVEDPLRQAQAGVASYRVTAALALHLADAECQLATKASLSLQLSGWIVLAAQTATLALALALALREQDEGMDDGLQQAGRALCWRLGCGFAVRTH